MEEKTTTELIPLTRTLFSEFQERTSFPNNPYWAAAQHMRQTSPKPVKGMNLSFSHSFLTAKILAGLKTMTIRPLFQKEQIHPLLPYRSRFRITQETELHLFFHLRSPDCVFIGDGQALGLPPLLAFDDFTEEIAWCDGFRSVSSHTSLDAMRLWFIERYGIFWAQIQPYVVIAWEPHWDVENEPFGQLSNPRRK